MRLVHTKSLPTCFREHPHGKRIVAEADIRLSRGSRLAAKLLVFKESTHLREFWTKALGHDLGRGCRGTVTGLALEKWLFRKGATEPIKWLEADPRYFCVIGLCQTHLGMEVICHEATHAGFAYAKRAKRDIFGHAKEFDEEGIAYPVGRIAAAINRFLHDKNLYP